MILNGLQPEAKISFLRSSELRSVAELEPFVMDHKVLTEGRYRPDVPIKPSLMKKATDVHRKLAVACRELSWADVDQQNRVLKLAGNLLYIVRSNIAHGEKTPYGPDLAKKLRDESVCQILVPCQELLCDLLLDRPSCKLVVYGTLAPGQPNHSVLASTRGDWIACVVRGKIGEKDGLRTFIWDPAAAEVRAQLFVSEDLSKLWRTIDNFEGCAYRRHLIPVFSEDRSGTSQVANIYVSELSNAVD